MPESEEILKKMFGIDCKKETRFEKAFSKILLILLLFSISIGIIFFISFLL